MQIVFKLGEKLGNCVLSQGNFKFYQKVSKKLRNLIFFNYYRFVEQLVFLLVNEQFKIFLYWDLFLVLLFKDDLIWIFSENCFVVMINEKERKCWGIFFYIVMNGNFSYVDVCFFYRYMKFFLMNKIIIYLVLFFLSFMYFFF